MSAAILALTIFAAASLRDAFEAVGRAFTARTHVQVQFDFGGSDTLATQIMQGAPADVFASANQTQARRLADAGLLAAAPRVFARNRPALIVPAGNPARIRDAADLARPGIRIVIAAPTVPVGAYARQVIARLAARHEYGEDYASRVEANVVSQELDVKAVVTKISLGEADAGIAYRTDVTPALAGKVRIIALPPGVAPPATYPIAPIKTANDAPGARAFIAFLLSPAGQRFLRAQGFAEP